jgi:SWI/SNF-related matrix-associated actin-dependent regulator 1 of chromatin subfamily A
MSDPDWLIEPLDGELALTFPYHPGHVAAIKALRSRSFDYDRRRWHVPVSLAPDLLAALEGVGAPEGAIDAVRPFAREALAVAAAAQARAARAYEAAMPGLAERHPDLFPHQFEGVEFLLRPREVLGAILADDMGLGKTRQAIVAAHEGNPDGEVLIICPASLKLNWAREIRLALGPGQDVAVVQGSKFRRARWTIVNYDLLRRHHAALMAEPWRCVILDEAHYIKNLSAQRTRLLLGGQTKAQGRVSGLVDQAERVYLLTGTPITNRPLDLLPLLRAIRHPLGDDKLAFGLRYCNAHLTGWGWDMGGASNLDELHARLEDVLLRRHKDQVLALPPKLRTYMPVEVDLVAYRRVWTDYAARMKKRKRRMSRRLLLAEIAKLKQAAALAKIPAAIALVANIVEQGEKVVVFTGYQAVVDAIMGHFGAQAVKLTGEDDAEARQAAVDTFQGDDGVRVFVGNLQAAGVGVSLTAASQVVFVDYSFVPADHLQAEDRPCRIGQTHSVTVTYLSAQETLDEEIEQLLAQKLNVVAQAIDGVTPMLGGSFVNDLLAVIAPQQG